MKKPVFLLATVAFICQFLCLGSFELVAQNKEFTRAYFPDQTAELNEARRNLRTGDKLFEKGGQKRIEAIDYYLRANAFNPDNAMLNYKIGKAYLETVSFDKAVAHLERAIALNVSEKEVFYMLGKAQHQTGEFQKALESFRQFRELLTPQEQIQWRSRIDRRISEAEHARIKVADPVSFQVSLLQGVNSSYDDYAPMLNADGTRMYFTSRRPLDGRNRTDRNDHRFFEKVFVAENSDRGWEVTGLAEGINARSHTATSDLAGEARIMITYRGDRGGDLFESKQEDGNWSRPKKMKNLNSNHQETSSALTSDGQTIYFISDRPGGYGGKDIWMSTRSDKGTWSEPVNLGPTVNTEYDEEGLFLAPDDKTLYFSSQGHNSMGGFDIFKTTYQHGRWTMPQNLGYPINSPSDDLFYVMIDEETALLSSKRSGGSGNSDIYLVQYIEPIEEEKEPEKKDPIAEITTDDEVPMMVIMRGRVLDAASNEPIGARIEIVDTRLDQLLAEHASNPQTGNYHLSLEPGRSYSLAFNAPGYGYHYELIDLTDQTSFEEIVKDIFLRRLVPGTGFVLNNIFFDFDKAELRPESFQELAVLNRLLVDNPSIKVEISGHTCNIGTQAYNLNLSRERALAVVNYLVERGISRDRLIYQGYGFSRPLAPNDTAAGREMNRRTEFEIIEN